MKNKILSFLLLSFILYPLHAAKTNFTYHDIANLIFNYQYKKAQDAINNYPGKEKTDLQQLLNLQKAQHPTQPTLPEYHRIANLIFNYQYKKAQDAINNYTGKDKADLQQLLDLQKAQHPKDKPPTRTPAAPIAHVPVTPAPTPTPVPTPIPAPTPTPVVTPSTPTIPTAPPTPAPAPSKTPTKPVTPPAPIITPTPTPTPEVPSPTRIPAPGIPVVPPSPVVTPAPITPTAPPAPAPVTPQPIPAPSTQPVITPAPAAPALVIIATNALKSIINELDTTDPDTVKELLTPFEALLSNYSELLRKANRIHGPNIQDEINAINQEIIQKLAPTAPGPIRTTSPLLTNAAKEELENIRIALREIRSVLPTLSNHSLAENIFKNITMLNRIDGADIAAVLSNAIKNDGTDKQKFEASISNIKTALTEIKKQSIDSTPIVPVTTPSVPTPQPIQPIVTQPIPTTPPTAPKIDQEEKARDKENLEFYLRKVKPNITELKEQISLQDDADKIHAAFKGVLNAIDTLKTAAQKEEAIKKILELFSPYYSILNSYYTVIQQHNDRFQQHFANKIIEKLNTLSAEPTIELYKSTGMLDNQQEKTLKATENSWEAIIKIFNSITASSPEETEAIKKAAGTALKTIFSAIRLLPADQQVEVTNAIKNFIFAGQIFPFPSPAGAFYKFLQLFEYPESKLTHDTRNLFDKNATLNALFRSIKAEFATKLPRPTTRFKKSQALEQRINAASAENKNKIKGATAIIDTNFEKFRNELNQLNNTNEKQAIYSPFKTLFDDLKSIRYQKYPFIIDNVLSLFPSIITLLTDYTDLLEQRANNPDPKGGSTLDPLVNFAGKIMNEALSKDGITTQATSDLVGSMVQLSVFEGTFREIKEKLGEIEKPKGAKSAEEPSEEPSDEWSTEEQSKKLSPEKLSAEELMQETKKDAAKLATQTSQAIATMIQNIIRFITRSQLPLDNREKVISILKKLMLPGGSFYEICKTYQDLKAPEAQDIVLAYITEKFNHLSRQ